MPETTRRFDAVLFDFGGVILTSPFEAFNRYEQARGLPPDLIRTINSTDSDANAWALFERGDIDVDGFVERFEAEAAGLGHQIDGHDVLALIRGEVRPEMVEVLRRVNDAGYTTACLTNNFRGSADDTDVAGGSGRPDVDEVMAMFDHVVESSRVGVRKPELGFYRIALERVQAPAERCVFLDDLGINLKPARAMGMTTIKVVDAATAISELSGHLGMDLGG